MRYSLNTRPGSSPVNEDSLAVKELPDGSILAVMADGMGGLDHGEIAAQLAVNHILAVMEDEEFISDSVFESALHSADTVIANESYLRGMKMGCAVAVVHIQQDRMRFVSLGNVRIYSVTESGESCCSKDDVFTDASGATYLTRSLRGKGLTEPVKVTSIELTGVSRIRICTDGFYNPGSKDDASVIDIFRKPE